MKTVNYPIGIQLYRVGGIAEDTYTLITLPKVTTKRVYLQPDPSDEHWGKGYSGGVFLDRELLEQHGEARVRFGTKFITKGKLAEIEATKRVQDQIRAEQQLAIEDEGEAPVDAATALAAPAKAGANRHIDDPTEETYAAVNVAYNHFNEKLFAGELPPCLITYQRKSKAQGFFAGNRFTHITDITSDEIALNPEGMHERPPIDVFATLVHEMVHLWQHHFGEPPRKAYHDKQWAAKMLEVGLTPSDTGKPGGRQTGQKMSDYVSPNGAFERAAQILIEKGCTLDWHDRTIKTEAERKKKNKQKYTCPECDLNAWAKPDVSLICGDCRAPMVGEHGLDV